MTEHGSTIRHHRAGGRGRIAFWAVLAAAGLLAAIAHHREAR